MLAEDNMKKENDERCDQHEHQYRPGTGLVAHVTPERVYIQYIILESIQYIILESIQYIILDVNIFTSLAHTVNI